MAETEAKRGLKNEKIGEVVSTKMAKTIVVDRTHMARRASDFGVKIPCEITVDMKAVKARKDHVSGVSRTGVEQWLKGLKGCTVYEGHARFSGQQSVRPTTPASWRPPARRQRSRASSPSTAAT